MKFMRLCRSPSRLFSLLWHPRPEMRLFCFLLLFFNSGGLAEPIQVFINDDGVKVFTNLGTRRGQMATQTPEASGTNYAPLITKFADQYDVDEDLIKAIIRVESNFDATAVSPKGCKGLMQLHPATAKRFGVQDVFDPSENIHGGVQYLHTLMNYFGNDLEHVLAAYNAGENAVTRHQGIPPYRETKDYVRKVKALYKQSAGSRRANRRIYRVVQPDGRVLFTNQPSTTLTLVHSHTRRSQP